MGKIRNIGKIRGTGLEEQVEERVDVLMMNLSYEQEGKAPLYR